MPRVTLSSLNQNLELHYDLHGSGKTKILFIMGLFTDGAAWLYQTRFFSEKTDYQCVTYDNRGCGRSSAPVTLHYSTTQMAKDALALIDHLQWAHCHVVGISMGGMIALEFALLVPERILSLTLLATHAGGLAGRAPIAGVASILRSMSIRDAHSLTENTLTMLYGAKTLANPDRRKGFYDFHTERFKQRVPLALMGLIGHLTAVLRHYVSYAELLRIRYAAFPTLILVGTEDRLVRETNSFLIQRAIGCRLIQLDDAGHGLQYECAEEVNGHLLNLFDSARKKASSQVSAEHAAEIKALEQCCQHRSHCLVHDMIGMLKGLCFGMLLCLLLSFAGLKKVPLAGIHLTFQSVILFGCLSGLRRAISCVANAFQARTYVREHRLQLDRAAHHGGVGVALPEEPKSGIPDGCGFDLPILPLIFIVNLLSLIYWTRT